MAEIQRLSIRHEAILDFLMGHPTVRMSEVAKHFGVTQGWLSQIIHSDAFQSKLQEKQDVVFHETVLPLREKMQVVAHQALDRLAETLPLETETRTLASVAESVLDRLGFGTKSTPQGGVHLHQHQHVHLQREQIEEARALIGAKPSPAPREVLVDGERAPIGLGATKALPEPDHASVGPRIAVPASISPTDAEALWAAAADGVAV